MLSNSIFAEQKTIIPHFWHPPHLTKVSGYHTKKIQTIVLTFSISITHDVLFDSLLAVVIDILFVPHPSRDCEMLVQSVVQFGAGNFNGVSEPVESENLILLLSIICGQRSGPLADGWWWEEVHTA